ncbi:hypothetical protein TOC8171_27240 [Pseudomonas syringae]
MGDSANVQGVSGASLCTAVTYATPLQDALKQLLLLRGLRDVAHDAENTKMILWNLPQSWIGLANDLEYFGEGHMTDLGPAVRKWRGNTAQAAGGEALDFSPRQSSFAVTPYSVKAGVNSEITSGLQSFGITSYHVDRYYSRGGVNQQMFRQGSHIDLA